MPVEKRSVPEKEDGLNEKRRNLQNSELAFVGMTIAWLVALVSTLGALFIGEVICKTRNLICYPPNFTRSDSTVA